MTRPWRVTIVIGAIVTLMAVANAISATAPQRPTRVQIEAQTRAAVRLSRARLVKLRVIPPNRVYWLTVQVNDPAAYLRYRADRVVTVMNRLTNVQRTFRSRYFAVLDRSGNRVLWFKQTRVGGVETSRMYIRTELEDCARRLEFPNEIDPEHVAPACPR